MFAVRVEAAEAHGFESRLRLYGVADVYNVERDQSISELARDPSTADDHVLLVYDSQKLTNVDIRRLTLNTVRLPRQLSVWDGNAQDNLVAARVTWQSVQEALKTAGTPPGQQRRRSLEEIFKNDKCKRYTLENFSSGDATRVGGSFAKSGVMKYFRKTASGRGAIKLGDEMEFYRGIPESIAHRYPELLFIKEKAGEVSFGIQYYDVPNLRDLILNCAIDAPQSAGVIGQVLEYEYRQAYAQFLEPTPARYLEDYHFHRVWRRLHMTMDLDPTFIDLISHKWLVVNGRRIPNIPAMMYYLERTEMAVARLVPQGVSRHVHADLHLENILVDRDNDSFMLVDPRGYPVCDIYYDLGKLAHSYNGKYDLLHEGRHRCSGFESDDAADAGIIDFSFNCPQLVDTYNEINTLMQGIAHEVLGAVTAEERNDVDLKTRFNEAMHFCSDMPFHIHPDAVPNIAVPIYATGALLLVETLELMGLDPMECAALTEQGRERLLEMRTNKWRFEA